MNRTPAERTSAERIDELLAANEAYRQRAIEAEAVAKGSMHRVEFWVAQYEKANEEKQVALAEVARLELKLAGSMPSLFDYAT